MLRADASVGDLSTEDSFKMIQDNKDNSSFIVLDVRTPAEYKEGHIDRSTNIDFSAADFADKISKLDKTKTYLVYCRSGHRSANAAALMKSANFTKIFNMLGGIVKWQSENRPVVR